MLGGNMVLYGSVCRVMWPLMMRLAQVTYLLPDGTVGVTGAQTQEVRAAYEEVWRVVELLRFVGGSARGTILLVVPSLLLYRFVDGFCSRVPRSAWCGSVAALT